MRRRWHYLYVIFYPSQKYQCYYGSRISDEHPDDDIGYFGSPITFARYNDPNDPDFQADARKVIIWAEYMPATLKSQRKLAKLEEQMIKQALAESGTKLCLNRNCAGRIILTSAELSSWASAGGKKSLERRAGFHALSPEVMQELRDRGNRTISDKYAKIYTFRDPAGQVVTLKNLRAFCRYKNLNPGHMRSVHVGRAKSHKGWTRYINARP